jgi:hypothetical protein
MIKIIIIIIINVITIIIITNVIIIIYFNMKFDYYDYSKKHFEIMINILNLLNFIGWLDSDN